MKRAILLFIVASAVPAAAADNQVRPYFGAAFGGGTEFVDPDRAVGKPHKTFGVSFVTLHNVFGWDIDVADSPSFFQTQDKGGLVLSSRVTTVIGDVVIAAPRSKTEYGLRPYFVGGAGLMRIRINDYFGSFDEPRYLPAFDFGGGAVGFLTNRAGVAWEIRRFESIRRDSKEPGTTIGKEQLSFWRASMAFVYRY